MKKSDLKEVFRKFKDINIIVIGDVMIDSYIRGKVDRISPEAPVPVVTVTQRENRLGGAANVAANLAALGAKPYICSVIGKDTSGDQLLQLLKENKLSGKGIVQSTQRPTTVKTRIIGSNHQMLRVDEETDKELSVSETALFYGRIIEMLENQTIHAILFEDYDKGVLNPYLIRKIIGEARKRGIPTAVDPKKKNFENYKFVTLFKPNLKEIKEGLKTDFDHKNINTLKKITGTLHRKQNIQKVFITLSESGVFISDKSVHEIIPAHIRNIADVSGAGDTVISVATLCMALRLSSFEMAALANLAGGLVCEKVGVVPVDKKQLFNEALKWIVR